MNKPAIKTFAVWARNKLIEDVKYRAGLMGISANGISAPLSSSTAGVELYEVPGMMEPYQLEGEAIQQRRKLVAAIENKAKDTDHPTAYQYIMEEVAYTWFNRLIAIRFMEVNDYLPAHVRVLSSDSPSKTEPDLVTTPFDAELDFNEAEEQKIINMQQNQEQNELFQFLFIRQCNALNDILPKLFEKTNDYTELLLNLSVTDQQGVVYRLVHDIPEENFNIEKGGQVEIIGWLYQYYNIEPKNAAFAKKDKITKEEIPAVTQLFTPDWIVRYMVENSLGRLWLDGHPNAELQSEWRYYLEEAEQEAEVQEKLAAIRREHSKLNVEKIKVIDPCMGSGHILVYAFDLLMQIYESQGYSRRDAAALIVNHNLYGLDIDKRAAQLAYFSVMMKGRQYDRRFFSRNVEPHIYEIIESNEIDMSCLNSMGQDMEDSLVEKGYQQAKELIQFFEDAKEYGSILKVPDWDWKLLYEFTGNFVLSWQQSLLTEKLDKDIETVRKLVRIAATMHMQYDVVVTNPPYMGISNGSTELNKFIKKHYPVSKSDLFAVFIEKCGQMTKPNGYQAMITMHSWMFLSSFEKLRAKLQMVDTINMAHLGARAFDEIGGEVVQTTTFVMAKQHTKGYKGTYCRLIEPDSERGKEERYLAGDNRYIAQQDNFSKIPGSPVAYWASDKIFSLFENQPLLESVFFKEGITTGDNDTYLRFWSEISYDQFVLDSEKIDGETYWIPCNKGGSYRKWYGNRQFVIDWTDNGEKLKAFKGSSFRNASFQRKEGGTFSNLTSGGFSTRYTESGFAFESKGTMYFTDKLFSAIGYMNTNLFNYLLTFVCPTLDYKFGTVQKLPFLNGNEKMDRIVKSCIEISKIDWDSFETSWDFQRHPLIKHIDPSNEFNYIEYAYSEWEQECNDRFNRLKANEEELNRIFIDIYGLHDELTPEIEDRDVTVRKADLQRDIKSLLSYAVGCMFGRYSLDEDGLVYAGGDWNPEQYQKFHADEDAIIPITDEEYLKDDIVGLLCAWLKKVYGEKSLEENLEFIAKALGGKGDSSRQIIRNYFLKDFYRDHCSTYSVTGSGKRPIYWLFDSGKQNGFKALIYLHRYTPDTIGNLRIDYLHRMQRTYEKEIERMQDMIDHRTNAREVAKDSKRKEKLLKQLKECRDYDEKISHLALSRIELDLDDGVKVNYRKIQTANDGKFYDVLADSKTIIGKK